MEVEVPREELNLLSKSQKNPLNDIEENKSKKKQKLFSSKYFRKQLNSNEKLTALQNFLLALSSNDHDYIYDYLEAGGSCLELLQTLESDSSISPILIFNLVTQILLRISAKYLTYYSAANESCRYLINNYLTLIHKMLGLSSSKEERKVCLKLLTAMVTFAPGLAKDVLMNVKFHSANIELLTKHSGEKDSVRDSFIHFLTAFLIDGNHHTLSILLEKSGLLTSILSGLKYDKADTVCVVISAMKSYILENGSISKTTKMQTFNTAVVKDVVNLYNWKGPEAFILEEKKKTALIEVDKYAKSKVSQCVHDFLLTLCTSHKYGVIFKDPLMGLGKRNQNSLIYTVLVSLDKPWEHSYAQELVVKICKACPDLTKNLWSILKPSLEPRLTEKWLTAMKFAKTILSELVPESVEFCAGELNEYQLAQLIQFLVAPAPILKVICPDNFSYESAAIKHHVVFLLFEMLKCSNSFLTSFQRIVKIKKYKQLQKLLSNYISKNFPGAQTLLNNWEIAANSSDNSQAEVPEYLGVVFDIFDLYKTLAPQLMSSLNSESVNLQEFLGKINDYCDVMNEEKLTTLQVKVVGVLFELDNSSFLPKTELFSFVFSLLLRVYHKYNQETVLNILNQLLKNTGIFESSFGEINIWLNGILHLDVFDDTFSNFLVEIVQLTSESIVSYQEELAQYKTEFKVLNIHDDFIETLLNVDSSSENERYRMQNVQLSPLILGFFHYATDNSLSKHVKKYAEFVLLNLIHLQIDLEKMTQIITDYKNAVPSQIFEYCTMWAQGSALALAKCRGKFNIFKKFSEQYLNESIKEDIFDLKLYPDFPLNLLQAARFYFSNLIHFRTVSENHTQNFLNLIKFLIKRNYFKNPIYLTTLLENPVFVKHFSILHLESSNTSGLVTKLLVNVVKDLLSYNCDIEYYLMIYKENIYNSIAKMIRNRKVDKVSNCEEILNVFGLEYAHCFEILNNLTNIFDLDDVFVFHMLSYCLKRLTILYEKDYLLEPLTNSSMEKVSEYFIRINNNQSFDSSILSVPLKAYLEVFPHQIVYLDIDLFQSILLLSEYKKENVEFCVFLLERNKELIEVFKNNIENIYEKKGVILPLANILLKTHADEDVLKLVYAKIEKSILKALQKPQKVGQHFQKGYGVPVLIQKFMHLGQCKTYVEKVHKFEVAEVFHVKMLEAVYNKVLENGVNEKVSSNVILIFVHLEISLFKRGLKSDIDSEKIDEISSIFNKVLITLNQKGKDIDLKSILKSEVMKTFWKFCLKFGVSGRHVLLKTVTNLVKILAESLEEADARLILEMLTSHSEFLDVALAEHSETKLEAVSLFLTLCENWNVLMERNHVGVLLASYNAKFTQCDRVILKLLKLYDSKAEQTRFHDFKPFLWGRTAATHYSVRTRIENAIIRQPTTSDVLGILKEEMVNSTILHYPLNDNLKLNASPETADQIRCYDLMFLLPLFSQLLAPEQQVKTYKFTRSGALSLTVVGLASQNKEVRQAACHVLARFHFHLEARHVGKDNLLWIRYVEALCKGTAVLPNFRLNNFAAIFFAKMAFILTDPRHIMYFPLSRYLSAKSELDFSTVPELYTLLHSPDVNYKEHRIFILNILKDGLRTEKDFNDFSKSMAFKLFSELYSSSLSDVETKLLVLGVLESVMNIPLGVRVSCENHSFLSQLYSIVQGSLGSGKDVGKVLSEIINICSKILRVKDDKCSNSLVYNVLFDILKSDCFSFLKDEVKKVCFEALYVVFSRYPGLFNDDVNINILLEKSSDRLCKYVTKYGCQFVTVESLGTSKDICYNLRLLFFNKCKSK